MLLVEDEAANIEVLRKLLARAGFRDVIGTTDPRRVSALVSVAQPDVVLLDLHIPRRDGCEVLLDQLPARAAITAFRS